MIDSLIAFFKDLLGIKKSPPIKKNNGAGSVAKKTSKSSTHKPSKPSSNRKANHSPNISEQNKYQYLKKYKDSDRYGNTVPENTKLEKNFIMKKIKKNIFFLNQLGEILVAQNKYESYCKKINELKSQSEGCYKIVFRIKEEAPYFQSTMKTVLHHTQTISTILKIK